MINSFSCEKRKAGKRFNSKTERVSDRRKNTVRENKSISAVFTCVLVKYRQCVMGSYNARLDTLVYSGMVIKHINPLNEKSIISVRVKTFCPNLSILFCNPKINEAYSLTSNSDQLHLRIEGFVL